MKINALQIDQASLATVIQQVTSGAAFSGNVIAYANGSGYFGGNIVYTSGGRQQISGEKIFVDSPVVPYSGHTGTAVTAKWVNDQIAAYSGGAGGSFVQSGNLVSASGQLATNTALTGASLYALLTGQSGQASTDYATKTQLFNTGAALSKVRATGGGAIQDANFSGIGGTQIIHSGSFVLISGGAGGGGSNVQVTGSSILPTADFTGGGSVVVSYDGTRVRVSGAEGVGAAYSGYVDATFVKLTGAQTISGTKTFATTPLIPSGATNGQEAVNLAQLSGASGVLASQGGGTINNYAITGTGTVTITNNSTGAAINNNLTVISGNVNTYSNTYTTENITQNITTGNYYTASFFFDPVATGLNLVEAFVGNGFNFTGMSMACRTTGFGPVNGGILTGRLYQADFNNTEHTLLNFVLNTGVRFVASGGFASVYVTGNNRIGISLTNSLSGIEKLSIGVFGY